MSAPSILTAQDNDRILKLVRQPEMVGSPYPALEFIRERPAPWVCPVGDPVFSRYEHVRSIMRDFGRFGQIAGQQVEPSLVQLDPPEHTRLRRLLQASFSARAIAGIASSIQEAAEEIYAGVAGRGEMDVVSEFSQPLVSHMIAGMVGLPFEDIDQWTPMAVALARAFGQITFTPEQVEHAAPLVEQAAQASIEMAAFFRSLVVRRKQEPARQDLLGLMIAAESEGDRLTESEIWWNLVQIVIAGNHTSVGMISTGLLTLLRHPEQLDAVRRDESLLPNAIEEMMRYEGPAQELLRVAREDFEFEGISIEKGQVVRILPGAANRDPRVFDNPDTFDITRANARSHLSFGLGPHACLGAALARAEALAAFRVLLKLPNLRLVTPEPVPWEEGMFTLPRPAEVRVAWDAD